jgi:hypothetical protein
MPRKRAQGAFEYILLLAGILLIVVVVIMVLRVSVIPAANQTLQGGLQQWQQLVLLAPSVSLSLSGNDSLGVAFSDAVDPNSISGNLSSNLTYVLGPDNFTTTDNKVFILKTSLSDLVLDAGTHSLNVTAVSASTGASTNASLSFVKEVQLRTSPYSADGSTLLLCHFDDGYSCEQGQQGKFEGEYNLNEYPQNTVLLMHFNNNSAIGENATLAADESGNGNNGTLSNGVNWTAGKYSNAVFVDRNSTVYPYDNFRVEVPWSNTFNITSGLTVEAWAKPRSINNPVSNSSMIVCLRNWIHWGWCLHFAVYYTGLNYYVNFFVGNGSGSTYASTSNIIDLNNWYHVAATYDGSIAKIYVNGVERGSAPYPYGIVYASSPTIPLKIGNRAFVGFDAFNGTIDEVRVLNKSLSAQEVWQHFKAKTGKFGKGALVDVNGEGLTFPTSGAIVLFNQTAGLWRFAENTGTSTADEGPNGNNGTILGGAAWTNGKFGKALSFDGSNDYVDLGRPASLNLSNFPEVTIEAWINMANVSWHNPIYSWTSTWSSQFKLIVSRQAEGNFLIARIISNETANPNGNQITSSPLALSAGRWYHVALVASKNNFARLYVDGELKANASITNWSVSGASDATWIGATGSYYAGYFNGTIDDVVVYSRALSADEIKRHYLGNFNASQGTLEMWVKPQWNGSSIVSGSDQHNIFSLRSTTGLRMKANIDQTLYLDSYEIAYCNAYNLSSWRAGEWHHIAAQWRAENNSATDFLRYYVDGVKQCEGVPWSGSGGNTTIPPTFVGDFINVGYEKSGTTNVIPANAVIDELRISNVTRTDFATTTYRAA